MTTTPNDARPGDYVSWRCTCCETRFNAPGEPRARCPNCKAADQYTYLIPAQPGEGMGRDEVIAWLASLQFAHMPGRTAQARACATIERLYDENDSLREEVGDLHTSLTDALECEKISAEARDYERTRADKAEAELARAQVTAQGEAVRWQARRLHRKGGGEWTDWIDCESESAARSNTNFWRSVGDKAEMRCVTAPAPQAEQGAQVTDAMVERACAVFHGRGWPLPTTIQCDNERARMRLALAAAQPQEGAITVDDIFAHCRVVFWPTLDGYPFEHNPHARKDQKREILAAIAKAGESGVAR